MFYISALLKQYLGENVCMNVTFRIFLTQQFPILEILSL